PTHAAIARGSWPAETLAAIANSAGSLVEVARRVSTRTLVYEMSPRSNASVICGSDRKRRPTRIHSRAVHTSMSATPAIQCAEVGTPAAAHSLESANVAASSTTARWLVDQLSIASVSRAVSVGA